MTKEIRILLIDDNSSYAGLLNYFLKEDKKHCWKVKHVTSLKEALDCLNQESYDLVISDYSLPECAAQGPIKMIKEKNLDIPIIIMSAHDEMELLELTKGKGAAKVLCKNDISSEYFIETIFKIVEKKEMCLENNL